MQKYRIVFYSPGTVGLGHMRRNLLIAQALAYSPLQTAILMIAEAREANAFAMPPGMDCLTLPALRKEEDEQCRSRHLHVSPEHLVALRTRTIRAAIESFEPDVLIVDYLPRGAAGELGDTLEYLRARGRTRCVLGLRDILGDPAVIREEWLRARNEDAIRDYYDAVWVYGDPAVYDLLREHSFSPDVAAKIRYTGYLNQRVRLKFSEVSGTGPLAHFDVPTGRLVLCLVGGGQDGAQLARAFAHVDLPRNTNGIILTGPYMPQDVQRELQCRAAVNPHLSVLTFVAEPALLLSRADRIISMGGYNTVCEVLSFEKPSLIVPRVKPRREQLIRAERLRDLGLIEVLHPDKLSPAALTEWLARDVQTFPLIGDRINLGGLEFLSRLLTELLFAGETSERRYVAHAAAAI